MLYFEDYASLRASLNAEEIISVLDAIKEYSESGCLPDEETFSSAALICWRFMRPKIDRDIQNYQEICEKRSAAARAPRRANAANAANAANPTTTQLQPNCNPAATVIKDENEAISSAADEFDLSSQIEAHQRADDLIRRYRLPDSDPTREALLEDAEKVGFDRLEEALKQASLSNNRQGLSVNFYRAILNSSGAQKGEKMIAIENL